MSDTWLKELTLARYTVQISETHAFKPGILLILSLFPNGQLIVLPDYQTEDYFPGLVEKHNRMEIHMKQREYQHMQSL